MELRENRVRLERRTLLAHTKPLKRKASNLCVVKAEPNQPISKKPKFTMSGGSSSNLTVNQSDSDSNDLPFAELGVIYEALEADEAEKMCLFAHPRHWKGPVLSLFPLVFKPSM
jgi:hypothetical protein